MINLADFNDLHFQQPSAGAGGSVAGGVSDIPGNVTSPGGLDSVLDRLLSHSSADAALSSSHDAGSSAATQAAHLTAAAAQREPQLMLRLLRLCILWLQTAAGHGRDSGDAVHERLGLSAAVAALEVLCAWASTSPQPAGPADKQLRDALREVVLAVAPAYAAADGNAEQPLSGCRWRRPGSHASDEPEPLTAVVWLLQLMGSVLPDAASDKEIGGLVASLAATLLAPLSHLPSLSSDAAQLHSSEAECSAEHGSHQGLGDRALLSGDGSMDWNTAQLAAEVLDVRKVYTGLGILTDSSGTGQVFVLAAVQQHCAVPPTDVLEAETVAALMLVAASCCATPPHTDAATGGAAETGNASTLTAADAESGDDDEGLLGALFAEDTEAGAIDANSGKTRCGLAFIDDMLVWLAFRY